MIQNDGVYQLHCIHARRQPSTYTEMAVRSHRLFVFFTLAVHSSSLNDGAFNSSSLLNFLNEKDWRSFLLGDLRQLGFFNEHIAVYSQSTSSRYKCCIYFLKIGFFCLAIWQWLVHESSFPLVHEQELAKQVQPPQQKGQDDFSPYKVLTWAYYLAMCCYLLLRYPQMSQMLQNPPRQHTL